MNCTGSSTSNCTSCKTTGTYLYYTSALSTCTLACLSGYYTSLMTCLACSYTCINCSIISTNCTACPITRTLSSQTCPCNTGYYDTGLSSATCLCII